MAISLLSDTVLSNISRRMLCQRSHSADVFKIIFSQSLWHTTVILALGNRWQRDHKLEAQPGLLNPIISCWDVAQLVEQLPSTHEPWIPSSGWHKPGVMVQTCNLNTGQAEAGRSEVQSYPWLRSQPGLHETLSQTKQNIIF